MNEETTPETPSVADTNGMATSEVAVAVAAPLAVEPTATITTANEEEAVAAASGAVAGDVVVYMEEGNAVEPTTAAENVEEMGEVEYLEAEPGEDREEEKELPEVDKTKTAEAAIKETTEKEQEAAEVAEALAVEGEEELEEEQEEEEPEEELITGDDAPEQSKTAAAAAAADEPTKEPRSGAEKQVEPVDENQCRVCTSKDNLVSLFVKTSEATQPADMLLLLCPSVSIALKDFMPQFICNTCLESLIIAIKLRKQLETTESDLRKRLSRSKNKVRRPRGYVVIDAPISESGSDDDDESDDVEFKVSDVAGSTSVDSDSPDSDASAKRKPGRRRARRKPQKRAAGSSNSLEEDYPKKRNLQTPPAAAQGPFNCDQCNLSFPRKQSYVMHRKTHDARHEFHCQICNKKFKVRGAYKTHMERHEAERAQFRCELCRAVFRLRAELKQHMAMRHDEHGVIYECKRCQRTFLTQTRLQRHQSTLCIRSSETKVKRQVVEGQPKEGRDLFKSVAPLTTTYWSDSFSD